MRPEEIAKEITIAAINTNKIKIYSTDDVFKDNENMANEVAKFYQIIYRAVKEVSGKSVSFN